MEDRNRIAFRLLVFMLMLSRFASADEAAVDKCRTKFRERLLESLTLDMKSDQTFLQNQVLILYALSHCFEGDGTCVMLSDKNRELCMTRLEAIGDAFKSEAGPRAYMDSLYFITLRRIIDDPMVKIEERRKNDLRAHMAASQKRLQADGTYWKSARDSSPMLFGYDAANLDQEDHSVMQFLALAHDYMPDEDSQPFWAALHKYLDSVLKPDPTNTTLVRPFAKYSEESLGRELGVVLSYYLACQHVDGLETACNRSLSTPPRADLPQFHQKMSLAFAYFSSRWSHMTKETIPDDWKRAYCYYAVERLGEYALTPEFPVVNGPMLDWYQHISDLIVSDFEKLGDKDIESITDPEWRTIGLASLFLEKSNPVRVGIQQISFSPDHSVFHLTALRNIIDQQVAIGEKSGSVSMRSKFRLGIGRPIGIKNRHVVEELAKSPVVLISISRFAPELVDKAAHLSSYLDQGGCIIFENTAVDANVAKQLGDDIDGFLQGDLCLSKRVAASEGFPLANFATEYSSQAPWDVASTDGATTRAYYFHLPLSCVVDQHCIDHAWTKRGSGYEAFKLGLTDFAKPEMRVKAIEVFHHILSRRLATSDWKDDSITEWRLPWRGWERHSQDSPVRSDRPIIKVAWLRTAKKDGKNVSGANAGHDVSEMTHTDRLFEEAIESRAAQLHFDFSAVYDGDDLQGFDAAVVSDVDLSNDTSSIVRFIQRGGVLYREEAQISEKSDGENTVNTRDVQQLVDALNRNSAFTYSTEDIPDGLRIIETRGGATRTCGLVGHWTETARILRKPIQALWDDRLNWRESRSIARSQFDSHIQELLK